MNYFKELYKECSEITEEKTRQAFRKSIINRINNDTLTEEDKKSFCENEKPAELIRELFETDLTRACKLKLAFRAIGQKLDVNIPTFHLKRDDDGNLTDGIYFPDENDCPSIGALIRYCQKEFYFLYEEFLRGFNAVTANNPLFVLLKKEGLKGENAGGQSVFWRIIKRGGYSFGRYETDDDLAQTVEYEGGFHFHSVTVVGRGTGPVWFRGLF